MIRAGRAAENIDQFLFTSTVTLGWDNVGDLSRFNSRESILEAVINSYPEYSKGKSILTAGMLYRFSKDIQNDDFVVTYNSDTRMYWIGKVTGSYKFDSTRAEQKHTRPITWTDSVSRDTLSIQAKNKLGSIATLFLVSKEVLDEMLSSNKGTSTQSKGITSEPDELDTEKSELLEDVQGQSREFIKDMLIRLNWEQMQELVAGMLRAMGYKTKISPAGSDRGRDIVASPDGFGFEQPRIIVEVKHRQASMGSQEIRSFLGGRHKDDKGLYVSTGGFTKDAQYEADRATIPLTLMNLDYLVESVIEHYDNLDPEIRAMVPLKRIYWPA